MNKLTYEQKLTVTVRMQGKKIGEIREERRPDTGDILGYRYFPSGGNFSGERFSTLAACKHSLEAT